MARYTRTPVSTLQGINNELAKVELAMKDTLDRKGVTPNFMDANLDMNSRRILNLPAPLTDQEPLRRGDVPTGLSVSAQYVDSAVEEAVQGLTSDYTLRVQNIDELKALEIDVSMVGNRIKINEYHAGTGYGGGEWKIVTGEAANDIDVIQSAYAASVQFKYILIAGTSRNEINPCCIGAKPSPSFDNAAITERAAELIKGGVLTFENNGRYELSRTVYLPVGISVKGNTGNRSYSEAFDDTVQFASQLGGGYVDNFLFFLNINPTGNTETWVTPFPNNGSGVISGLSIDGTATDGIHGFKFAGSYEFKELDGLKVGSLVRKPNIYTDKVKASSLHGRLRSDDTSYFVDLPGLGDGYEIQSIAPGYTGLEEGLTNGLYLGLTRGADISNLINGNHLIERADAIDLHSCHQEGGDIIIRDSSGVVRDNILFRENDVDSRIILESESIGDRYSITLERNVFSSSVNRRGGWIATQTPDIIINSSYNVTLRNNVKRWTDSTAVTSQGRTAALIGTTESSFIPDFKNYAHILTDCTVVNNQVNVTGVSFDINNQFNGIASATDKVISDASWLSASGTYYYNADIVLDPVRMIGRNAELPEVSVTKSNGGALTSLAISWGSTSKRGNLIFRLYRGTSSGSYDKYVDIPIIALQNIIDNGNAVNGIAWQDRPTSGVEAYSLGLTSGLELKSGRAVIGTYGGIPNAGTWKQGDFVSKINTSVDANGMILDGYRRLTNGSANVNNTDWALMRSSTTSPAA